MTMLTTNNTTSQCQITTNSNIKIEQPGNLQYQIMVIMHTTASIIATSDIYARAGKPCKQVIIPLPGDVKIQCTQLNYCVQNMHA